MGEPTVLSLAYFSNPRIGVEDCSYDGFVYCVPWGMLLLFLLQDLVSVKFTPVADTDSKTASIVKETRYMCPVTRDVLSNSVPCVLLRPRYMCV